MELTYDNMVKFMDDYFPVYSEYGQDPATVDMMKDYYAPDFIFTGYIGRPEPITYTRDTFLEFDVSHPSSFERLTPIDYTIDERRGIVFAIIKFEFIDRNTGDVLVTEQGITQYYLFVDENDTIKIKKFFFYPQRIPVGQVTGSDIFMRDATAKM